MASISRDESSEDDLYGDIDDMYVSQSETESIHKSNDTVISDIQNLQDTSKPDEISQEDPGTEDGDSMNDLDLYDDLIAEEDLQKVNSFQEMMKKFEEAMKMIQQLESENKKLRESLNKQETSSKDIQRNFSSLLITAKGEINRKDKELNTLRKQLSNKQRTPGRNRSQRETTTETSSFTSIDSDFDPLCVSSPGRQKWQRYKSPKKYPKDTEKYFKSGDVSTDRSRKEYGKSVEKYDRRRRSRSKDKEEGTRSKIRTDSDKSRSNDGNRNRTNDGDKNEKRRRDKDRRSDDSKSSKRFSENESDVKSSDERQRKVKQVLNSKTLERVSGSVEITKENRRRITSGDRFRYDRDKDEKSVNENKKYTSVESKVSEKNDQKIEDNENFEKSGIKDSGNKPKVLDLREKLRLKRLSEDKQNTDLGQIIPKIQSSLLTLSKSVVKKTDSFKVSVLNDSYQESTCKTLSKSESMSAEKESRKQITKKESQNLVAEKEFLEQLKISIKKNELSYSSVINGKHLENKNNKKEVAQNIFKRDIVSYSDASNECSDMENITDNDKTISGEKYFTASPDMSELNETSYEDAYGEFSTDNMDSDKNTDKSYLKDKGKWDKGVKDMEIKSKSTDELIPNESISGESNHSKDSHSFLTENAAKYRENSSECDNLQNNGFEPMDIQSTTNSNVNTESQIPFTDSGNGDKMDSSQADFNFDNECELKCTSINTSPNVSDSSKNEETPGSGRRRSARLLSKSESSLNCGKTSQITNNVCTAEADTPQISEECVETTEKMTSAENNKSRNLQRLDSRTRRRKRVRRCVTSETISSITSVSDSDIFNSVSDEAGDISMSTDDTENSEDTISSESSGKLQNLVCTDKNCSIKMRHLHPKSVGDKTKSPEFLKENCTYRENEFSQNLNETVSDDTDKMDVDDKELNNLKCLNAAERLKSVDVDSELENIHACNENNVHSGTIEITAEQSVDDSESSYSSSSSNTSSSDSCSSSESSDSESESDTKDENIQMKIGNKIIESSDLVTTTENRNLNLINDTSESTNMALNNVNTMNKNSTAEFSADLKIGEKEGDELKNTGNNTGQSLTSMDNAVRDKMDTYISMKENYGIDSPTETNPRKKVDLSNITDSLYLDKEAETVDKSSRKGFKLVDADIRNNIAVTECVTNKVNMEKECSHSEQSLGEKTINSNPQSLNTDAMESNSGDQATYLTTDSKEKETKRNTAEASGNESDGSFGSNIMSERTDSLHSEDESEFPDSDDSGSSYSGESTSSSDESGTGSSWETYSTDSETDLDSEDDVKRVNQSLKNKKDKPEMLERKDNQTENIQNVEENACPGKENVVEMEDMSKAKTNNSPMETDDNMGNETMTNTDVDKYIDLSKKMINDMEMGADNEREIGIGQCPSLSEKKNSLKLKSPEKLKTAKKAVGISPDRSHMLQCLLNCVQNELQHNKSLVEKFNTEENMAGLNIYESSVINQSDKDVYSEPVANNVEVENATLNEKNESCQMKSSYSENSDVCESKKVSTAKSVDKEQEKGKIKHAKEEKMIVDNESEGNNFDAELSSSDNESYSGSSSGSTHPTDCSTCSSYSGSSSDSETESDNELRQGDVCRKEVACNIINVNSHLNATGKSIDIENVNCKEKTVHSTPSENIVGVEKRNETMKGNEVKSDIVNESVTDLNGRAVIPCKNNNPYWIADELPKFLLPKDSTAISDKNKSNDDKKLTDALSSSSGAESSRPETPAVKFANLSPRSKGKKIEQTTEVQLKARKVKNNELCFIPSVVQDKKELVNDNAESSKNLETNVSKKKYSKHSGINSDIHNKQEKSNSESNLKTDVSAASEELSKITNNLKFKDKKGMLKTGRPEKAEDSMCDTKPSESSETHKQKSSKPVLNPVGKKNGAKKKETKKVSDKEREEKQNLISKRHQDRNSTKTDTENPDKKYVNQSLRRSPRKKPSQISVTDAKDSETSKTRKKKHFPAKVSEKTSPGKEKSNDKKNSSKYEGKCSVKSKKMEANKLAITKEKGKNVDRDKTSLSCPSSSTEQNDKVDLKDANRKDKYGKNDISDLKEISEHSLFEGGIKLTSSNSKKEKNKRNSDSEHMAKQRENNVVRSHFRDTTKELSEKIIKLKVEHMMLKNELAEKQRKENDSLKMKLTIPRLHDPKLGKDAKENIKGKAPVQSVNKPGKTQPLKVAMAANGHEEIKSKTGTTKTGSLNKNENLTFEERLGDYEGYISKTKSFGKLKKRNIADPSLSLTVQNASLKKFTIPKLLDVRKTHKERKKDVTKSKSESSVSQKYTVHYSSKSGNSNVESKTSCKTLNRSSGLKSDNFKKDNFQTKANKRFIVSESESGLSDSDIEGETDSSNAADSDAMEKAIFGSSDSSGNSKKSLTLADLCKTRSSEDTDDIVKDSTRDEILNPKEGDVLDKIKDIDFISCNKKDAEKNKDKYIKPLHGKEKTKMMDDKKMLVNKRLDKEGKGSKQVHLVHRKSSGDIDKSKSSGNEVEKEKNVKSVEECLTKDTDEVNIHHTGSKKVYTKTKECENDASKAKCSDHNRVNTKSDKEHKEDSGKEKFASHQPDKEKERRKLKAHPTSSEQTLRKSPRIKVRSPVKEPSNCENSKDEAGLQGVRRSNRTPSKSDQSKYDSKNEVRYFELSDKNPILSKIISPKKPKLNLDVVDSKKHSKVSKSNSKVSEKLAEKDEKEAKGVPILLLEESTMDGIDYHDDVTLDTGSGSQCSEDNVNNENDDSDASGENSDTDLSVEEGELSDSEDDSKETLKCIGEPLKKSIEVTPKKQNVALSKGASGRSRISPVRFLPESTSSYDGESSCKCSKKDCIHSRLSLIQLGQRKRYKSDSDSASDSNVMRQKRRFRPDNPAVRDRSRDEEGRLCVQSHEKCSRKSPVSHRRSPPRRRPRSRSTSSRRRQKRSQSPSLKKSRLCRNEKEAASSRYRNDTSTDSPRSHRRNRCGSRERSVSRDKYSRRRNQSFRDSNSESTIDAKEKRDKVKKHYLEKSTKEISSEKCTDNKRNDRDNSDNNFYGTSDEESERFSKLKSEKMCDRVKGKQSVKQQAETRRVRHNEGKHFRENSDYVKSRHRSRSKSRSPQCSRRRKRLRSDSESEVSERVDIKDKRGVGDKQKDTDSPTHKRSRPGKSGMESSNEYSDRSRKR